jgi:hypothetical protein
MSTGFNLRDAGTMTFTRNALSQEFALGRIIFSADATDAKTKKRLIKYGFTTKNSPVGFSLGGQ